MEINMDDSPDDNASTPRVVMMSPKEITPSLFGSDVNPPTTSEDDLALRESIARDGVQVPLTLGRVLGKGKLFVVKGTRRHATALALNLSEIPVEIKDYASVEEMRQDAICDNLIRRQFTTAGRADLACALWISFDNATDKKEMAAKGFSPRKRAAIAGGLSEGSLAAFRYVLDSGDETLIAAMRSGEYSIDKAHKIAKMAIEGGKTTASGKRDVPVRVKSFLDDLDTLIHVLKALPDFTERADATRKALVNGRKDVRLRVEKKMKQAANAIADVLPNTTLDDLRKALSSDNGAAPDADVSNSETDDAKHGETE